MNIPLELGKKYILKRGTCYQYTSRDEAEMPNPIHSKYFTRAYDMMVVEITNIIHLNEHFIQIKFSPLNYNLELERDRCEILFYDNNKFILPEPLIRIGSHGTREKQTNAYPIEDIGIYFFNSNDEIFDHMKKMHGMQNRFNSRYSKERTKFVNMLYNARIADGEKKAYDKEMEEYLKNDPLPLI